MGLSDYGLVMLADARMAYDLSGDQQFDAMDCFSAGYNPKDGKTDDGALSGGDLCRRWNQSFVFSYAGRKLSETVNPRGMVIWCSRNRGDYHRSAFCGGSGRRDCFAGKTEKKAE